MNRFLKRFVVGALSVTMLFGAVSMDQVNAAEKLAGKLVVIHTNDIHGRFDTVAGKQLGISAVADLKNYYEQKGANVLLLDAGDFSQGNTLASYYQGMDTVYMMNEAGYDAVSLGNHEFDYGFDELKAMADAAEFPILDANILDQSTGEVYFDDNKVFDFGNMKVGVFGLDTPEAQTKASPKNVEDITILQKQDLYNCAQSQINELKGEGCDYIICVGHLGISDESTGNRSLDVAAYTTGIDLFVDGHSHSVLEDGLTMEGTKIVSTGTAMANIGVAVFDGYETKSWLENVATYEGGYTSAMNDFVASYKAIVDEAYQGKFATSTVNLNGERNPGVRTEETNLGDFAADAYLYTAQQYMGDSVKVDGAIQNGGGVRASIPAGDISMNTLYTVFPFGNTVSIVKLSGAQLLEALEASCSACPNELGGFPQVSGIQFTVDTSVAYAQGEAYEKSTYFAPANPGSRVSIDKVGGRDFKLDDTYYIAVNNFMAAGGDTYSVFTDAEEVIDTGVIDAEGLISYVASMNGVIGDDYAAPKGNITIK